MMRASRGDPRPLRRHGPAFRFRASGGFTFAELIVAAVVLLVASVGVLQSLAMMVRHSEHHQRDIEADQLLRTTLGYLRDVGYDGLVASGSAAIASSFASQYRLQLAALGAGASLGVGWVDTIPGSMLDATVSVTWKVDVATQSLAMATRIAKGGPL